MKYEYTKTHVRSMHTRLVIHVTQDLSATNTYAIDTSIDGVRNVLEFEAGRWMRYDKVK